MRSPNDAERNLSAPETLGLDTRVEIRKAAIKLLEEMPEGVAGLVSAFPPPRHVDSAGLGALMLIQRRAAERRQIVALRNISDEIRFLLVLTKLDDLFQLESALV